LVVTNQIPGFRKTKHHTIITSPGGKFAPTINPPCHLSEIASQMEDNPGSPTPRVFSLLYHEFINGIRGIVPIMSLPENSTLKDKILNPEETKMSDGQVSYVTFQLEILGVIQGLQHQVVDLTSTVDTLVATVKTLSNKAKDLFTNVAASAAKTTPQVSILQRPQTKSYAEAAAQPPKTPVKGRKRSATQGPTPLKNPKQKQRKEA